MPALRSPALRGLVLAAALLACGVVQAQQRYRVESLGVLGPDDADSTSYALALNDQGVVVGTSNTGTGGESVRAFIHENGRMRALGSVGGLNAIAARAINERGQVTGWASSPAGGDSRPFLYDRGSLRLVGSDPGDGYAGLAHAINESGQVAGTLSNRAVVYDGDQPRFIPVSGQAGYSEARGLNDHGVAVGGEDAVDGAWTRAFVWDGSRVSYLPTPQGVEIPRVVAVDINNTGQIAVNDGFSTHLYSNGGYQPLGSLRGSATSASGLNDKGWVVGSSEVVTHTDFPTHAFLFRDGRMVDLNDLLDATAARQWELHFASDINERGQIVGMGRFDGLVRAYLATPVPEPGTWALLLAGLGGVAAAARRRRAGNATAAVRHP